MNELALFAGIGGGLLASRLLGWVTVAAVEIEDYRRKVVLQRQSDGILEKFPIWDDVQTFDGRPFRGFVDIITGGFPCQDVSVAGKGLGICAGKRSGLWKEFARIIAEIGPAFVFIENSPLLTIRGLDKILSDVAGMGYHARWCSMGTWHIGGNHKRERMFVLAYSNEIRFSYAQDASEERGYCIPFKEVRSYQETVEGWSDSGHRIGEIVRYYNRKPDATRNTGGNDGLADRVDRVKSIGDGQVPQVVVTAFNLLNFGLTRNVGTP